MADFIPTARTKLKRLANRGSYDRDLVFSILDEGFICHVAFAIDGQPFVIPTTYGRSGDRLFIHGSPASRMLREMQKGIEVCIAVTLLDGLVLARSAFHSSLNYRSVVIFGIAELVEDPIEKEQALFALSEHLLKGRWQDVRAPSERELRGTTVMSIRLQEVSAKTRSGPPIDDEEDYALPVWAGVLPLSVQPASAVADPRLPPGVEAPDYVSRYQR